MVELLYKDLTFAIIGAAMEVHRTLGPGFLEAVYQKALAYELRERGIPFEEQVHLRVIYKDLVVGEYIADFVADWKIILEIKGISALNSSHHAQTLNYLSATGYRLGLLLNFGAGSLQHRRVIK